MIKRLLLVSDQSSQHKHSSCLHYAHPSHKLQNGSCRRFLKRTFIPFCFFTRISANVTASFFTVPSSAGVSTRTMPAESSSTMSTDWDSFTLDLFVVRFPYLPYSGFPYPRGTDVCLANFFFVEKFFASDTAKQCQAHVLSKTRVASCFVE